MYSCTDCDDTNPSVYPSAEEILTASNNATVILMRMLEMSFCR